MMRTHKLSTGSTISILIGFFLFAVVAIVCRIQSTKDLVAESFSGKISKYEFRGKMTMAVWVRAERYSISGFATYLDSIKVGDSLHKDANSRQIYYYKEKEGKYYLFDVFTIY